MLFFGNQPNGKKRIKSKEEEIRHKKSEYLHKQLVVFRSDQGIKEDNSGQHFQETNGDKCHPRFLRVPLMDQQHQEVAREGQQAQKHIDLPERQVKIEIVRKVQLQEILEQQTSCCEQQQFP